MSETEKPSLRQLHKVTCVDCEMIIYGLELEVRLLSDKLKEREALLDKYAAREVKEFLNECKWQDCANPQHQRKPNGAA